MLSKPPPDDMVAKVLGVVVPARIIDQLRVSSIEELLQEQEGSARRYLRARIEPDWTRLDAFAPGLFERAEQGLPVDPGCQCVGVRAAVNDENLVAVNVGTAGEGGASCGRRL